MNKLVRNEKAGTRTALQSLTCNLLANGFVRHDTMEGRNFIVVPMVILTEGVHHGSDGDIFYPKEELSKTPAVWNHKPIVVYHPEMNGVGISACDPDVITNRKVGVMMNTKFEKGRLKSEAWIEEARANKVDLRIMAAIEEKKMMELSTGLFVDVEQEEGQWKDESYSFIAHNFRPDHLALLPDQVGACSIKDGAGFLRNVSPDNRSKVETIFRNALQQAGLVENEMSFNTIRNMISDALRKRFPGKSDGPPFLFVEDVYSDFVIYEFGGKLFKLGYSGSDTEVTLGKDQPLEVVRVTEYRATNGTFVSNATKETKSHMKKTLVDKIIANNKAFTEENRDTLMGLSEDQLKSMAEPVVPPAAAQPAAAAAPVVVAPAAAPVANVAAPAPKIVTLSEYIAQAPVELQSVLQNSLAVHDEEKAKLVELITANKQNPFTQEDLNGRSLNELRGLARLAGSSVVRPVPTYAGQASITENAEAEEAMEVPIMNFGAAK